MKLFIANCTKQNYIHSYRVPEESGVRTIPIRIGAQVQIPGDFSQPQIDGLIRQHAKYGMIDVAEVDRTKPFVGLCYAVDKKIPVEKIVRAMTHNEAVLEERGRDLRRASAVASSNLIEEHLHRANEQSQSDAQLSGFEMTIEEESQRGKRDEQGLLKEGISVSHAADPKPTEVPFNKKPDARRRRSG